MSDGPGRVLAIDFGTKRIGLAVSDPLRILAGGIGTIPNDPDSPHRIGEIVREQEARLILIGMPYAPDGGEGATGARVRAFMALLQAETNVPVEPWDESFSSEDAKQAIRSSGARRKQRREKGRVDEMAARLILQDYLDNGPRSTPGQTA